jgi:hypothetical protein
MGEGQRGGPVRAPCRDCAQQFGVAKAVNRLNTPSLGGVASLPLRDAARKVYLKKVRW